jgi:hypothetical protein
MKNKLSKFLQPMDFSSSIEKEIGAIDFGDVAGSTRKKDKLFLRNFTAGDLLEIMKRIGLISHLEGLGLGDARVTVDIESRFVPETRFFEDGAYHAYDMVVIEWLSAQNPYADFEAERKQLPGQKRPGLGILRYCFEMMYVVAREVIKDGFLDIPDHVHGAIMYSRKFKFFDPVHEGVIRALMRDCGNYSLADISWGVITGTIIELYKNEPQPYAPSEQVFYVSDRMRDYFHSKKYLSVYHKYYRRKRFRFDYEEMQKRRAAILEKKSIVDL